MKTPWNRVQFSSRLIKAATPKSMCERSCYCANIVGVKRSHFAATVPSVGSLEPAGRAASPGTPGAPWNRSALVWGRGWAVQEYSEMKACSFSSPCYHVRCVNQRRLDLVLPQNLCVGVRVCARSFACVTKALVTVWIFTVKRRRHSCPHLEPFFTLDRTMSPSKRLCFGLKSAAALALLLQPLCNIWVEIITSVWSWKQRIAIPTVIRGSRFYCKTSTSIYSAAIRCSSILPFCLYSSTACVFVFVERIKDQFCKNKCWFQNCNADQALKKCVVKTRNIKPSTEACHTVLWCSSCVFIILQEMKTLSSPSSSGGLE